MRGPYRRRPRRIRRFREDIKNDEPQEKTYTITFKHKGKNIKTHIKPYHYPYVVIHFEDKHNIQLLYEIEEEKYIAIDRYSQYLSDEMHKLYTYTEYIDENIDTIKKSFNKIKKNAKNTHSISIYGPNIQLFLNNWQTIFSQTPLSHIKSPLRLGYVYYIMGMMNGE